MLLEKFSLGVGDRFGRQAEAQLAAFEKLEADGILVVPVWNKSHREHTFTGTEPASVRQAAAQAVQARRWKHGWHVDADHIRLVTVDGYLNHADFFTIDVADEIGQPVTEEDLVEFTKRHEALLGVHTLGSGREISLDLQDLRSIGSEYLRAVQAAGVTYRHIASAKGEANFIAEVSLDETESPQTPKTLLVLLAALAAEGVQAQTIAPKFTGRFNKGVDYVGDLQQFEQEFLADIQVLAYASHRFGLPENLKLSVHSGSDKFSLYPVIRQVLHQTGAGLHLKTAGTTWLEELIGLSEAGGEGLALVKRIYGQALSMADELCRPYASVIAIDLAALPSPSEVDHWSGPKMAQSLRHEPHHPDYRADMRQLMHVSFKLAAKAGEEYLDLLSEHREIVAEQVTKNLYVRHMRPLWVS